MSVEQSPRAWRMAGLSVAVLLLLVLGFYRHTVIYLAGLWNEIEVGEYAHGYLVVAISVYLIIRNRQRLLSLVPCAGYRALPAVLLASLLWTVSSLVDVQMMQTVGLLLLVLAVVWMALGNAVTRALLFPILFLAFAIPIWFPLSPLLQNVTADVVFGVVRMLGIPALRQENIIVLPAGSLSIEEACSGLRYLLASLTLGTLYAYLNYTSFRTRLVVVCVSAGAALLANFIRVFIVVYLGYTSEMQHPLIHDHLLLGWYLFGGLVAVLLFVDTRLHRHHPAAVGASAVKQNPAASVDCSNGTLQQLFIVLAGAALLSAGPVLVYGVHQHTSMDSENTGIGLPAGTEGWKGPVESRNDWMPAYHGAVTAKQDYVRDSARVTAYIGYYPAQRQGEELINELNRIDNNDIWHTRHAHPGVRYTGDQQVLENLLENDRGSKLLVWYWYRVAGRLTTNRYEAKVLQVLGLVTRKPQAFVVAIATDAGEDTEDARALLGDFLSAMEPALVEVVTEPR